MAVVEGFSDSDDEWEENVPISVLSGLPAQDRLTTQDDQDDDKSSSEKENEQETMDSTITQRVRHEAGISKSPPATRFEENIGTNQDKVDISSLKTVADYFYLFLSIEFLMELVHATNQYAAETQRNSDHKADWTPEDLPTMKVFICLCMLIGIIDKPRIKDYWTRTVEIATPFFPSMMKRDRFVTILS